MKRQHVGLLTGFAALAAMPAYAASSKAAPLPRPRPMIAAMTVANAPPPHVVPLPRKRPQPGATGLSAFAQAGAGLRGAVFASRTAFAPMIRPASGPFATSPASSTAATDIAAVKRVLESTRKGKEADAEAAEKSITDPVARKLAEWVILRSDNTKPSFQRYADFIATNPSWPHAPLFRRRAENALWNDKLDDAAVLAFFANHHPATAKGRYVLARALLAKGDRAGAEALVRHAWRYEDCSADVENRVIEMFGGMLTHEDHKARMEQRFYVDDVEAGMRAATRLGGNDLLIGRARAAVSRKLSTAKALLDAVPAAARHDAGYIFSRVQWLMKNDQPAEAGTLMLAAPTDPTLLVNLDQWWNERRILVRKLLDDHDAQTAYRIARDAAAPNKGNYRVDQHFTAGWIALRFLHDPATAAMHFAHIPDGTDNPHALARGGYWQGRTAETMGNRAQAKAFYEEAARHTATYYGQLARARLGLTDLGLRGPPPFTPEERAVMSKLEIVRAVEILYALDERDMLASIYAEIGESGTDIAGMAALGEVAAQHNDGRSMLLLGQGAYGRGLPLDYYAYPTVGLPDYKPIGPPIEAAVAYSIARQESHFNQKVVSTANAMGFMQVTPVAGEDTAKRYHAAYSRGRLLSDPIYNMQMGAGELANLLGGYKGSYILTFAGYNAGRGRVRQWIAAYGDPREPQIDPVDWVERIPLAETRNYVERIME
ncbi:MAG TPA: transglycosylase SLT domain-containing protein, partial [Pseudolabrys sp.]|nr:transglycosylase SLT domain-containing protein [Pseudolabrys sp.]